MERSSFLRSTDVGRLFHSSVKRLLWQRWISATVSQCGYYMSALEVLPVTTNVKPPLSAEFGQKARDSCFVLVPVLIPRLPGGSEVLEVVEMERGCQNSSSSPPQLLPIRLSLYSTLAAKSRKRIKEGQHERLP